jgi:hypothetical protein
MAVSRGARSGARVNVAAQAFIANGKQFNHRDETREMLKTNDPLADFF